ncbi:hypothetical protein E2562_033522 [Oryza meyeriana var. granulata]|uniref:Phytocyanin domain-containing protein n=1 Tax=Oryza meyeriana var. granulata TaxID=110450 RepID=A0A6G1CKE1_9ORYZ|nr:hypothetical protein E2562_033522 [Oryza meyeriana var. granulata]
MEALHHRQIRTILRVSLARVVLVDEGAYDACNTSASFAGGRFDDGSTVFTFDRSGPFFFISGNEANCRAGEKLIVVVMADRSGRHTPPPAVPPPVAPMPTPESSPPSPAPTATPTPSLAPSPVPLVSPMAPAPAPLPGALAPTPAPTTTTPSSPLAPAAMAPSPSTTPGGVTQPPPASVSPPPGTEGANSTTPAPPAANDRSGAAPVVAGVIFFLSVSTYVDYKAIERPVTTSTPASWACSTSLLQSKNSQLPSQLYASVSQFHVKDEL